VALRGDLALIGAWGDDDAWPWDPEYQSGAAYVFDVSDPANPVQLAKLLADDADEDDRLGEAVSIHGGIALAGASNNSDMGWQSGSAYIFQAIQCPADFDGDGDVDTADLLFLLGAWGTPDGDVDGDGDTDTADLLALLAAWGPCS
jgi:hypothetical protein